MFQDKLKPPEGPKELNPLLSSRRTFSVPILIRGQKEGFLALPEIDVNYELEEFIYLLKFVSSVYDKVFTDQPICNVL